VEYLTQLVGNRPPDDLLLNVLFLFIGASVLALAGLCIGLVANGAADPLRQRLGQVCNNWLSRLRLRRRPRMSTQARPYRNVTRR